MSRTLRIQTLSLSLTSLKTHLRQLHSTHLPHSSTILDKLIDTSPTPIPDEFLDEQDRLEDQVRGLKGVEGFLKERMREWVDAENAFWKSFEGEKEAEKLREEVREGVGKLSVGSQGEVEKSVVEGYEKRLVELEEKLKEARGIMEELKTRPLQSSHLAPDQRYETSQLLKTLEKNRARPEKGFEGAKEMVEKYREGVEVIARAKEVRSELEDGMRRLREVVQGVEELGLSGGRLEDGVNCLERTEEEAEFEKRIDQLYDSRRDKFSDVMTSCKVGSNVVVELGRVGVDPNARRELKALVQGVEPLRKEVEDIEAAERMRRRRVRTARDVVEAVEEGRKRSEEIRERLRREIEGTRWEKEKSLDAATTEDPLSIEDSMQAIRQLVNPPFELAKSELERFPSLFSHLSQLVQSLNSDLESLKDQQDALRRTRRQRKAIQEFEAKLNPIEIELERIVDRAEQIVEEKETGSQDMVVQHKELEAVFDDLSSRLSPLLSDVHLRIPFLSSSTSPTSTGLFPFEPIAHDEAIRLHINTLVARVNRFVDEGKAKVRSVKVVGRVKEWDDKVLDMERKIGGIEDRLADVQTSVIERENDSKGESSFLRGI